MSGGCLDRIERASGHAEDTRSALNDLRAMAAILCTNDSVWEAALLRIQQAVNACAGAQHEMSQAWHEIRAGNDD